MTEKVRVSRALFVAVKLAGRPAYRIAQEAEINPATLSKLLHGAEPVRHNDPRILRVAQLVGVSASKAFRRGE